jgi:DGQHR domain-containing protein
VSAIADIKFKCIEVTQPVGTFYVGAMDSNDVVKISYADVRRLEKREVEQYLGIERPLSQGRVAELREYVKTVDATFPTSVILAIPPDKAEFDSAKGVMKIANEEDVAKIIDGQHRIAGLETYSGRSFQVNTTIFVDMDMEDQAMVFATINLKQTKVTKSLAYDLYEYANSRSPQKTCHNIAKLLNTRSGSPFKERIKILGIATGKPEESLTQATFVDRLMKYITREPMKDRDDLKRGRKIGRAEGRDIEKLIFRNFFVDDQDAQIAKIIWNYFSAVAQRWPVAWSSVQRGVILNRTTGFGALMRFLRAAYVHFGKPATVVDASAFLSIFDRMKLGDDSFVPEKFVPGSSGESELFNTLCGQSGLRD